MDEPTKIQLCGLVAGIIASDDEIAAQEAGLLDRIRKRFGLAKSVSVPTIDNDDEIIATLEGFSDDVRKETLWLLIQAAAVDGKITPEERSFLEVVADKFQVDRAELDRRVERQLAAPKPKPLRQSVSPDDDDDDD
ncbi:MAG: hypothetical protein JRI68_30845 [Deltaproteobacteria bacterium]|nr:hypothetical protein [Deltaproteobacteria bacterium]